MAETMATELLKVVFKMLADEALKRVVRSQGIHGELKELGIKLSRIQDLLNDASGKEVTEKSVKEWLNSLQHLAYDIGDVLDDLATDAMHRELTPESTSKVRKLIPTCCTNFSITHRLSPKLDSINKELEDLEKQNPGLIVKGEKPNITSRRNQTSLPDVSGVVGREVEVEILLNKLLTDEEYSKENFSVVPIVGMGGVGKTTLARLLYNHTKVNDHFILKSWVCISDDFDIVKISNTILQSVTKEIKECKDLNQLQIALTEQFKDKRFLLVVDDVWHENYDDWENLVRPFHLGAPGSRIIITTRNGLLLNKLGFHHLDILKRLSDEDALSLFAIHALGLDNFDSHTTLKSHGEGIVKKCAGLPLAIKAVGRLLRSRRPSIMVEDWDDVLKSEIWDIEDGKNIIPALRLSYHELSADLKQLFVYCSLFPKDYMFDKEELVLLWMAEGFLNPSNATKSLERLGHEYFEIMLSRSFFQHAPNDESLFMMHDLMVDLATFVAGDFFLRFDDHREMEKEALVKTRHMSFFLENYVGYQMFEAFKGARGLRTFLAVSSVRQYSSWDSFYISNKILVELLPELELLRVLSLSRFHISEVPECIGNMKHLRYLNLSKTAITELPENVGNLYNLETLNVFGCGKLTKLPKSFIKLKNLRHFDMRGTGKLKKLPLGVGEMKSLRTLSKIIIEGDYGFALHELKNLKNLHGVVSIEGLHNVQSAKHAREANLSLKKITELRLEWDNVFNCSRRDILEKEVLDDLKPNSDTLKELRIVSYGGTQFSNWIGDSSFHKLVDVWIHHCELCISLPLLGQLPSLKMLSISSMNHIRCIGLELTGSDVVAFPSLESLKFRNMLGWEVWSTDKKVVFPCLRKLQIENCPNLVNVSLEALPSLRVLSIDRCDYVLLRSLIEAGSLITNLELGDIAGLTDNMWRGVMKYLGKVEELRIRCKEIRYVWKSEAEASKVFVNLKRLRVFWCHSMVSLGEDEEEDYLGNTQLSSLRALDVDHCDNMIRVCCPNSYTIESLEILNCKSITHVSFPSTIGRPGGKNLKSLEISGCEKLTEKINNTNMPMLEWVKFNGWRNLKSITEMSNFIHLNDLELCGCSSIESFSHLQLPSLQGLSIESCKMLNSLPELSSLTLLQDLTIKKCPSMIYSFPDGIWPPNLVTLEIGKLKKPISEWGTQNFPASLVDLTLYKEDSMSNGSQLSHLLPTSLTKLHIHKFKKLETLSMGLQHLMSLQHLQVSRCLKMIHLPETLLPSLLSLEISFCRQLKERCNGRGSQYWPLISHIPCIDIE